VALGVIRAQFYPLNDVAKAGYSSSESSLQSSGTLRLEDPNNFTSVSQVIVMIMAMPWCGNR
jgi:hypothetical protein